MNFYLGWQTVMSSGGYRTRKEAIENILTGDYTENSLMRCDSDSREKYFLEGVKNDKANEKFEFTVGRFICFFGW